MARATALNVFLCSLKFSEIFMGKGNRKHRHISTPDYRANYEQIFGKGGLPETETGLQAAPRRKPRLFDKNNGPGEYTRSIFTGSTVYQKGC